jgi:hypothetical protein
MHICVCLLAKLADYAHEVFSPHRKGVFWWTSICPICLAGSSTGHSKVVCRCPASTGCFIFAVRCLLVSATLATCA